ncbi:Ferrienterobactin-binding periplasmic protein [Achromobacter ruhlandii]|uniref:Fe2+-enterobactin ABC transporter substrate-binding protein n=1 Tax=Achromobacter ruhlandii TaxID=72557 RepID=UPI0014696A6F|nr:Fe2+-enterobactin ABC transporter substrate-binding protein [Achromobacter ruhlandii]CAB3723035.1 Ferrienterobactin-binding periplasmic protein [Achromobacter ruhlandii]
MTACRGLAAWLMALALGLGAAAHAETAPDWPRRFDNADGTQTTLVAAARRVLSTSVTVTGTLLAIEAPLVASAGGANGRFFDQWAAVARERGLKALWPAGQVDLEAAYAARPDLIIVSATGADSAREQLDALRAIAPVIVVDYSHQTWQELAMQLGRALGIEAAAARTIAGFDARVAAARARLRIPEGAVNIVSYNGPGTNNPIATPASPHARLLASLGFRIEVPDPAWHVALGAPGDFVWAPYEALTRLTARTTFVLRADAAGAGALLRDPVLANLPSVRAGQVYGLGRDAFRIDAYSAGQIIDTLLEHFGT